VTFAYPIRIKLKNIKIKHAIFEEDSRMKSDKIIYYIKNIERSNCIFL